MTSLLIQSYNMSTLDDADDVIRALLFDSLLPPHSRPYAKLPKADTPPSVDTHAKGRSFAWNRIHVRVVDYFNHKQIASWSILYPFEMSDLVVFVSARIKFRRFSDSTEFA